MNKVLPHERRRQVFKILMTHGPLSIRGIEACLEPRIQRQRLKEVLSRLYKRGLIQKRYDKAFGGAGVYYQIAQEPSSRAVVAEIISVNPDSLCQPEFRHRVLLHSESCAIWFEVFKRLFPGVRIVREHEIESDILATRLLLLRGEDDEVLPDLLLIQSSESNETPKIQ